MAKRSNSEVFSSLLYIIIGVVLAVFKSQTLGWAMTIAGVFFVVCGVLELVRQNWVGGAVSLIIGIAILVLGVVAYFRMTPDLLPNMDFPYVLIVTTYPGASPERVESDVIKPMESALGTISGVKNVYSTSSENYGMVQLEFEDDTDMDSALVKVSSATQEAAAGLPDTCGTPSIMELSMDMMATMYVSVAKEGADIYELSSFVKNEIQPYIERQEGVASVSPLGLVEQSVHIELDKKKIDDLNAKLLETVDEALSEAAEELEKAEKEVQAFQNLYNQLNVTTFAV